MALENLVGKTLVACRPTATLLDVAKMMAGENVGAVLVTEDDEPVGIVTDRDLVVRGFAQGPDVNRLLVSDVMTPDPETVRLEDGIFNVIEVMKRSEVRRVPIVDKAGKAVGLISFGDIFQLLGREISMLCENLTTEQPKIDNLAA